VRSQTEAQSLESIELWAERGGCGAGRTGGGTGAPRSR
jgi:hypothetical protein